MATIDLGKIKLVWKGTYAGGTAYVPDDVVAYTDGSVTSTYICTTASTGNAPSSGGTAHGSWAYMAKGQATSPTTTQGDIIYRGASADARLAKGTAGQVLTMNSGATAPEWAAAAATTKLRGWAQYSNNSSSTTTTVNSFQDSNFTTSNYAPSATDSVLLVTVNPLCAHLEGYGSYSSDHRYRLMFRIQRDIGGGGWNTVGHTYGHDAAGGGNIFACDVRHEEGGGGIFHARRASLSMMFSDAVNTTSNVRYKIQYCAGLSGQNVGISNGGPSYIRILEVAP